MVDKNASGCIMADGMGLGKTVSPFASMLSYLKLTMTASMHFIDVDTSKAVPRSRQDDHPEMHHCVSVKFGRELGKRTW